MDLVPGRVDALGPKNDLKQSSIQQVSFPSMPAGSVSRLSLSLRW